MSALGEMAGGIAHEINTPLATIQMVASSLIHEIQNDIPDLDNLTFQLQQIERTCDRVAKIIKGLKTFARDGSSDPFETVSAHQLIQDAVALCSEQLKRHKVDLRLNITNEDIFVTCRPIQICQVLLNLIGNAKDAVENMPEKWVQLDAFMTADAAEFRIIDGGPGIPKSLQQKIFQPFFTTKGVGKGTGMGLSISLGIIKAHSGTLQIDNSQKHTCFVLKLPLAQAQAA
jgi:C4-dicarboxylate-specific signal transduction histidine kinase